MCIRIGNSTVRHVRLSPFLAARSAILLSPPYPRRSPFGRCCPLACDGLRSAAVGQGVGSFRSNVQASNYSTVIARLDRAIQYSSGVRVNGR